ncbi:MAG: DUF3526 domain-containing protein [Myxococcales bacterium FL481]|nr:MAG: DUF3526 domain-containing protein [Myxococcales bacterium FL481]
MITAIVRKELRCFLRSGVYLSLAAAMLALFVGASSLSAQRIAAFERERVAAEAADRDIWLEQGERNPHSAAHFSRYAFKPTPHLVAFDPGTTDFSGLAVWMEAHNQNPAVFRRAEDLGDVGRFASLSPAWILQTMAPLFLFLVLFGSIAGEREQGTLRQLSASGVSARSLVLGKFIGASVAAGLVLLPGLILGAWATSAGNGSHVLVDQANRLLGLIAVYGVYVFGVGTLAIGVSARFKDKRTALVVLVCLWVGSFALLPRLATSTAVTLHPQPDLVELAADLRAASKAFYEDKAYQEQLKREQLAKHNVERTEDLPFDYGAYQLQKSEEHAHPRFDAFYDRLDEIHRNQERVLQLAAVFSPVLALQELSAGLAGSDRRHHRAFTASAEQHRRVIIRQLNEDLMHNARGAGRDYVADVVLWEQIRDFSHVPPTFDTIASEYAFSMALLVIHALAAFAFATAMLGRALRRSVG